MPVFSLVNGGFAGTFTTPVSGSTFMFFMVATFPSLPTTSTGRVISCSNGVEDYNNAASFMVSTEKGVFPEVYRNNAWVTPAAGTVLSATTPYLVSGFFDGTNMYLGINGTYTQSSSTGSFSLSKFGIGLNSASNNTFGNYTYGEILMYNCNLYSNDRQTIEGYLAWKWGLQSALPTGHPY
jgi:hypothetical protein